MTDFLFQSHGVAVASAAELMGPTVPVVLAQDSLLSAILAQQSPNLIAYFLFNSFLAWGVQHVFMKSIYQKPSKLMKLVLPCD
jgi:hypothetical protein